MKIIIAGGSGLIGSALFKALVIQKHSIVLLSRNPDRVRIPGTVQVVQWDSATVGEWAKDVDGADAIINLTGESIAVRRWTSAQKRKILSSRIDSTRAIVSAIEQATRKPSVLINASAVGYYGNVPEEVVEEDHPKGNGFLSDVCEQWEREALRARELGIRVVLVRTGIVLDKNGGALQKLLIPFKLFVGGPLGSGKQWFPWIHLQDEVSAILYAMQNEQIAGPVNLSAPEPVRMAEFCKVLGKILHRPSWLPMPEILLKLVLGEMAKPLLFDGQKAISKKLLDMGFKFQFPALESALTNILHQ
jgi:uncharacterized protein (TIGR01777 family)